jgi:DNA-binding NarL/FixJ family response regulator
MGKTNLMIVDDHEVVIQGLKGVLLEHPEFDLVGEARTGREALKLVDQLRPDIVIMDITMPELNGIDATLQIKRSHPAVQIVVYTMHAGGEYVISLFRSGIAGYILKNEPLTDLVLALKAVKRGGTYFTAAAQQIILSRLNELEKDSTCKDEFQTLSLREREVMQLLAEGKTVKEIADQLCISPKTVETHKYNLMQKLNITRVTDLVKIAIRQKLIDLY